MIRKECYVSPTVLAEVRRIVEESEIMHEDDNLWPMADRVGAQELVCSGHGCVISWFVYTHRSA
jgi:hypothetical protein